jgi:hypothetical protein
VGSVGVREFLNAAGFADHLGVFTGFSRMWSVDSERVVGNSEVMAEVALGPDKAQTGKS